MVTRINKNGEYFGKSMVAMFQGVSGVEYSSRRYKVSTYENNAFIIEKATNKIVDTFKSVRR
ncbi:hypothetical protein [Campylobacter ureolyticus]|uniref:Uncharacterized protein n=1 Tax=Campylobacter ureolyticus TaxID=827 RepID=A0A9Q4PRH5_9BACT|nr:hypothetical protein [Campylobacter ureolyticus]MCZ6159128.1 hypothetical protein [Campylobacter ureolyticus]MCZ6162932.1 hypothetical protein [Campylobacter ureolyticus]MCZ6164575.1 hypothetical protein [Campylobacter ureolyticus]